MTRLLPTILIAFIASSLSAFLILSLLQPKYDKKVTSILMLIIVAINTALVTLAYIFGDFSLAVKIDILAFVILYFIIQPFFTDSFMQWLFSCITVLNIRMCIFTLSFSIRNWLPYSTYMAVLFSLLLGFIISYILSKYARRLYRNIVKNWHIFIQVASVIFILFLYFLLSGQDIFVNLREQAIPMLLLVLLTLVIYLSLFNSIENIFSEFQLREDNLQMKNNQELLYLSTTAMEEKLVLLNDIQEQYSIANHDRRHFSNTLIKLLTEGKIEESLQMLQKQTVVHPLTTRKYCDNVVINAAVSYYMGLAEDKNIKTETSLEIPNSLNVDSLELALVISNLLENAIEACVKIENQKERCITFTSHYIGRLILEITNSYRESDFKIDENGYPVREDDSIGTGTKSILAFVEKNDSEIFYKAENKIFRVRMIV